ncbi:MAG: hypothetical protein FJW30_20170 [Acidobacteria bacterium]|nr:hypothetical protein [Acidobacteriota bacterium]
MTFPNEFRDAVRMPRELPKPIRGDTDRLRWFARTLRPEVRKAGLAALERTMTPYLRAVRTRVDPETIHGMTANYSETLPKSLHNNTVMLNNARTAAYRAAQSIGLVEFLTSGSLKEFAETVSGFSLEQGPGLQVICYKPGDYVGPHNDHHPEEAHLRDGYVDLQITLCNDHVERQYLLYERDGFFNQQVNIGIPSGVSVSMLPFWHQVTPMVGKNENARRWLLLVSFVIR